MKGKIQLADLWKYREARTISIGEKFILLVMISAGIISMFSLADWWFREDHIGNIWLFIVLSFIFWSQIIRIFLAWINYLHIKKPEFIKAREGLSVAIFTTSSPGEPLEMFEKTLAACKLISYPHTTYLLDDTRDPAFRAVAEKNGAVWLEIVDEPGAKAGKINQALKMTNEEFILVLDPDHIPFSNFLDNTLGFFNDEEIGFVQVSQAYYNQYRSFTAKGAAEQTYNFYGPTQMGLYGLGCCVAIGANCTFRRKALESIGGHGIGLAEDLITSIRIHSEGWKSVYNPVIISRGLVPEDFGSFCKQQLKWSRGVFEVAFVELPRLFRKLNVLQKVAYATIGTYYLVGTSMFFYLVLPFLYFLTGILAARLSFADFVIHGLPFVLISIGIYLYVQKWMCHGSIERGLHLRGMILKFACWPVFILGFLLAVVNAEIPYIPTAKKAVTGFLTPFVRPLIIYSGLFLASAIFIFIKRRFLIPESELILTAEKTWGMVGFAFISFFMTMGGILAAWESMHLKDEDPWDSVDLTKVKI